MEMGYDLKPIDVQKKQIVQDLFINTADDNYITARWCFIEELNVDYFWLAVHALEKYMKAVLLLNGKSSKGFSHDIVKLYKSVKLFALDLLPDSLEQPDALGSDYRWLDESPEKFLQRLYNNGNPDNRYQIFGFVRLFDDLFKLDLMIFALRRLCVPLNGYYIRTDGTDLTYRDMLMKQPEKRISSSGKLEKTVSGKRGERLRELLLSYNFPFAPDDFPHGKLRRNLAFQNPVLSRLIIDPLDRALDKATANIAVKLTNWAVDNIQVPQDVKKQLQNAKANCKAKWKI